MLPAWSFRIARELLAVALLGALLVVPGALPAAAQDENAQDDAAPVVLAGVAGLRWEDLDPQRTPNLWGYAERAALGSISVRTTASFTCPADGWLTVNAGRRAAAPRDDRPPGDLPDGVPGPACPPVPAPDTSPDDAGASVPRWQRYVDDEASARYDARLGLLGTSLAGNPGGSTGCPTAVGAGAVLGLADRSGAVPAYVPTVAELRTDDLAACEVSAVDLGTVEEPGFATATTSTTTSTTADADVDPRGQQVARVDARLGQLLDVLPPEATLVLVTVADSSRRAHLGVAMAAGPGIDPGWLVTPSTRRQGLVQLTDVLATMLSLAGVRQPAETVGQPMTATADRPPTAAAVAELVDQDTAAVVTGRLLAPFTAFLVLSQLVLYGAAAVALRRRWGGAAVRLRVLRAARVAALGFAAFPVASYLAGLVPWGRQPQPVLALVVALTAGAVGVTAVALLGSWRRQLLGPATVVAAVTAAVLTVDVWVGSPLQLNALLGYSPLVAGRFYGFGNIAFALFATSAILATAGLTAGLVSRGARRTAGLLAAAVGLVAVVVNGSGSLGTDFGGVIALVPGFAVLAMGLAGIRITWRRLAASLLGGAAAITVIATLDWIGPPQDRSHPGRFVQQVLDGDAVGVVQRKLAANLDLLLGTPFGLIVPAAILFLVFVLMRPLQWRAAALERAYSRAPTLRPGLTGAATALVVGFAVNDSGIVIPAVGLAVAVPLALAVSVTALERDEVEGSEQQAARPSDRPDDGPPPGRARAGPARTTA